MNSSIKKRLERLENSPARPPCTDPREMSENELWAAMLPLMLPNINKDQRAHFEEVIRGMCRRGEAHTSNEALTEIMEFDMKSIEGSEDDRMIPVEMVAKFLDSAPPWWSGLIP